jgi:hypothetical protein
VKRICTLHNDISFDQAQCLSDHVLATVDPFLHASMNATAFIVLVVVGSAIFASLFYKGL